MKKPKQFRMLLMAALIAVSSSVFAQVKIGTNPTTIEPASNLEVEASTTGRKVKVNKTTGQMTIKDGTEGTGKVLTSDAAGGASWQTGVGCASSQVRHTGSQTVPLLTSNGPGVTLIANTEIYDPGNAYNPSTGIYTAPASGYYIFSGSSSDNIAGETTKRRNSALFLISSVQGLLAQSVQQNIVYNDVAHQNITAMAYLTAGEQIRFVIQIVHRDYNTIPLPTDANGNPINTMQVTNITFNGTRIDCNAN